MGGRRDLLVREAGKADVDVNVVFVVSFADADVNMVFVVSFVQEKEDKEDVQVDDIDRGKVSSLSSLRPSAMTRREVHLVPPATRKTMGSLDR